MSGPQTGVATGRERTRVAVLFGGRSPEHEVSISTALEAIRALDARRFEAIPVYIAQDGSWHTGPALLERAFYQGLPGTLDQVMQVMLPADPRVGALVEASEKPASLLKRLSGGPARRHPIDVVLPALHGTQGEDGCVQGLLELAGLAYVGCRVTAAAMGMDKAMCKRVLTTAGVPVLPGVSVAREAWRRDPAAARGAIRATPGLDVYPLFIKPQHLGSSIGIGTADNDAELDAALARAFRVDSHALVEPRITQLYEINVSVLRTDGVEASVPERPISKTGVLTFEDKYGTQGGTKKSESEARSMAAARRKIDPDDVPADVKQEARRLAKLAFETLGCDGVARIDFLFDLGSGRLWFNEINTLPGSLSYYLWERSNPPRTYTALLSQLIDAAIAGHRARLEPEAKAGTLKPLFRGA